MIVSSEPEQILTDRLTGKTIVVENWRIKGSLCSYFVCCRDPCGSEPMWMRSTPSRTA